MMHSTAWLSRSNNGSSSHLKSFWGVTFTQTLNVSEAPPDDKHTGDIKTSQCSISFTEENDGIQLKSEGFSPHPSSPKKQVLFVHMKQ